MFDKYAFGRFCERNILTCYKTLNFDKLSGRSTETVLKKGEILITKAPLSRGKFFYSANNSFPRPAVYFAPAAKPFSSVSAIKLFSISSAVK